MKHHDGVKRALATPDYFVSGSSGCGEGHALAEKSTWFLVRMQPDKHSLVRYGECGTHSLCPTLVYPPKNSADYGSRVAGLSWVLGRQWLKPSRPGGL